MIIFLAMVWLIFGNYMFLNDRIAVKSKTVFFTILGLISALVVVFSLMG